MLIMDGWNRRNVKEIFRGERQKMEAEFRWIR